MEIRQFITKNQNFILFRHISLSIAKDDINWSHSIKWHHTVTNYSLKARKNAFKSEITLQLAANHV